jgi:hypothetical protein
MSDSKGQEIFVGRHRVVCEPDLYVVAFIGELTDKDIRQFHELNLRYHHQHGYLMYLADASQVGHITAENRRLAAQLSRQYESRGVTAIFGASLLARTLATLLLKAISLSQGSTSEFAFFKSEAAARAWLDAQRPRLLVHRRR